jgi:uncharacterized membrane protein YedE/YeeE
MPQVPIKGARAKSWSPYVVGALLGVLSCFAFVTVDRGLGITTPFEHTAAIAERAAFPALAAEHDYFLEKTGKDAPKIGWEWFLVVGVFVGSLISSKLSGDRRHDPVPPLWRERFGGSTRKRYLGAFVGGALLMIGARLAQGCTSGHGITGALQLAVSSWIFGATFFGVGIAVAMLLFPQSEVRDVRSHP